MLAQVLGMHPECLALHEPVPRLLPEGYACWSGTRPREHIRVSVRRKRRRFINQVDQNGLVYVESAHYTSHLIPVLHSLFDAKFVHLFRNGRDFVRSGLERKSWYNEFSWLHPEGMSLRERVKTWLQRRLLVNFDSSYADHRLEPPAHLKSRFEKICWLWNEINRTIVRDFDSLPESTKMSLKLEAFGRADVEALHDFIGLSKNRTDIKLMLERAGRKPNKTDHYSTPPPREWTQQQKNRFSEIAGDTMNTLGYSATPVEE